MMPRRRRLSRNSMRLTLSSAGGGSTMQRLLAGFLACRPPRCAAQVSGLSEQFRQLGHERLVGEVELERRHRDAVLRQCGDIGAVDQFRSGLPNIGDPIIRNAAPVLARVDMQALLM